MVWKARNREVNPACGKREQSPERVRNFGSDGLVLGTLKATSQADAYSRPLRNRNVPKGFPGRDAGTSSGGWGGVGGAMRDHALS